jgi:hypothetical protein
MPVGQSDASNPVASPGTDGSGSGVPDNNTIVNWTNLANSVAVDVAGVYRTVNSPPPATSQTLTSQGVVNSSGFNIGGIGLVPVLLISLAAWLIFR